MVYYIVYCEGLSFLVYKLIFYYAKFKKGTGRNVELEKIGKHTICCF